MGLITLQDIFCLGYPDYEQTHALPAHVRKAARATGMRTFQEEGLVHVAKGVTSLAELQRVLKE